MTQPNTIDSTPLLETAPEDLVGDTHVHYDDGYKQQFATIATLFEDIQADVRSITDRLNDRSKGSYIRNADTVACNPANVAASAAMQAQLEESGLLDQINAELANPTDFGDTSIANYGAIQGGGGNLGGNSGSSSYSSRPPGYGGQPTITTQSGDTVSIPSAALADIVPAAGEATGDVKYGYTPKTPENPNGTPGKKRDLPIQQALMDILNTAAQSAGVDVLITSGGQVPASEGGVDGVNRTGSNRHDRGYGADVALYVPDFNGRQLTSRRTEDLAIMIQFMQACRDAGATAVGQGNGYMSDNVVHVDIAWTAQQSGAIAGIGAARTWGGGSATGTSTNYANAPQYMKDLMTPRANA